MNPIAEFVKTSRRKAGLTQEEFAMRSGLGLRLSVIWNKEKRQLEWIKSMWLSICLEWKLVPFERRINNECLSYRLRLYSR